MLQELEGRQGHGAVMLRMALHHTSLHAIMVSLSFVLFSCAVAAGGPAGAQRGDAGGEHPRLHAGQCCIGEPPHGARAGLRTAVRCVSALLSQLDLQPTETLMPAYPVPNYMLTIAALVTSRMALEQLTGPLSDTLFVSCVTSRAQVVTPPALTSLLTWRAWEHSRAHGSTEAVVLRAGSSSGPRLGCT